MYSGSSGIGDRNWGLDCGNRIDLLVGNKLVIVLKAVDNLNDIHLAQTLTYLKLGNLKLVLLINFSQGSLTEEPACQSKRRVGSCLWHDA
ncbi:MAG: GxxExxY protein [Candidatus Cloacimonetes bacterium]|nr:GxxExxY protein [Candidatus Cloacimonadota bacterium]MBL7086548.1 GxxExxY protein [Candidatus Cloacimonadota bacterium]